MTRTLQKTIYIQASPDIVWHWITDPDKLAIWFHKPAAPLTQSGPYRMIGATSGQDVIWGDIRDARPPHYLEHSFQVKPLGDIETIVTWTLQPVPGGTQLTLVHSGLPDGAEAFSVTTALDAGWDEHFGKLRTALANT